MPAIEGMLLSVCPFALIGNFGLVLPRTGSWMVRAQQAFAGLIENCQAFQKNALSDANLNGALAKAVLLNVRDTTSLFDQYAERRPLL